MEELVEYTAFTAQEVLGDDLLDKLDAKITSGEFYQNVYKYLRSKVIPFMYVIELPNLKEKQERNDEKVTLLGGDIYQWFITSNDIYNQLTAIISNPTDKASVNTIRYNDTPQNGGDWSDDRHTSTITRNETSNSLSSAEKLEYVQNLTERFIHDFKTKFMLFED